MQRTLPALLAVAACGGGSTSLEARGQALYSTTQPAGNTLSCNLCHAIDEPAADGLRRPAHPLSPASHRPGFKAYDPNRPLPRLIDAVNVCLTTWMKADLWTEDDERFIALHAFLEKHTPPGPTPPLAYVIGVPPDDLSGGVAARGASLFAITCAICHGPSGQGTPHAPQILGRKLDPKYIARRIRRSGLEANGTSSSFSGGVMPFWMPDRMSDAELVDIVAYVAGS